jgi:copper-(or silver)-translocating P-type ATPase
MKQNFEVIGMTCSACQAHIEKALNKLKGVDKVNVNLLLGKMVVEYDESVLTDIQIVESVTKAGYGAEIVSNSSKLADTSSTSDIMDTDNAGIVKKTNKIDTGNKQENIRNSRIETELKNIKQRFIISMMFLIPLMYVSMGSMAGLPLPEFMSGHKGALAFGFTQFLFTLPIVYINRKYYKVGFKTLFRGSPNMDTLIAIGSLAAVVYGIFAIYRIGYGLAHMNMELVEQYHMDLYFESAGTILTLITLGEFLETRSKGHTSEAITKLMDLAPKTAIVIRNEEEQEIPIEQVNVSDIVIVRPGQSIPVDGVILEGSSAVDQSALTGESIPVDKNVGDKVIAATINKSGYFIFKAEKVGDDTTFSQIIRLVEEAGSSKAPIAKLADKISGIFVPIVIIIAFVAVITWLSMGYGLEFSLSIGIAVLVISCPCALGLATPVAIMVGTGKGAEHGILIKSAEALEELHKIQVAVLDKTGTVTEGKPKVTDIVCIDENIANIENISNVKSIINEKYTNAEIKLLEIAATLEKPSEHPLGNAIVEEAKLFGLKIKDIKNFNSISGRGIIASDESNEYLAGNLALMTEQGIDISILENKSNILANEGKTPLYFARNKELLGIIAVADVLKATSKAAIEEFKRQHIDVVMLTGDNERTARAIQAELGIDRVIAEVMPEDKELKVREIQESGKKVAMIGDGINDAPALVRADVGIAIGAGTDVAIEAADIVLMKSDLLDAVTAISLSKAVIKNIKMNLFWAFLYNLAGIPLAAGVFYILLGWKLNPMFAAAAMSLSSVCVISNALRLKFFKPKHIKGFNVK